jgi:hypothetical protein
LERAARGRARYFGRAVPDDFERLRAATNRLVEARISSGGATSESVMGEGRLEFSSSAPERALSIGTLLRSIDGETAKLSVGTDYYATYARSSTSAARC